MRALNVLGWMKWPSIAAITLFPVFAYFMGNWPGYWAGEARALYGPAVVGGHAVALTHPARERPTDAGASVVWTAHLDEHGAPPAGVALAYAIDTAAPPTGGWHALTARHSWVWSGTLPAREAPGGSILHVWIEVTSRDGARAHRSWPAGTTAPLKGR